MTERADVAVIGAGITGLAAAWEARRQGADVVVLEASERPGGKLRTSPVAGVPLDESADAFLARVPEAVGLCTELGIDDDLVAPRTGRAYVWARSALRPLPEEQLLGVPTDLDAVAASGILSAAGLARARQDLQQPAGHVDDHVAGDDEPVGALVRRMLGDEVNDSLVAPLIGGIWAGDCDRLSVEVAAPMLAEARRRDASLIRGAVAIRTAATADTDQPVFLAPRGGMARLIDALTDHLGDDVRLGRRVEALTRDGSNGARWTIEPVGLAADSVIATTPAPTTAELVQPHAPGAAAVLGDIEHASVVLVALAVPRDRIAHPLDGSGFLVPPTTSMLLTACSWASSKWELEDLDSSTALLRVSAGRDGDDRAVRLDDTELVHALLHDLGTTMGLQVTPTEVTDVRVTRWNAAFPQPRPGHLHRVGGVENDLRRNTPGLVVAGNWARGVGIPACIRAGREAATSTLGARSSFSA
jgi:protoporphyrinogen/coproporphyrinogen III oxidase